jgi:hypothetical protein
LASADRMVIGEPCQPAIDPSLVDLLREAFAARKQLLIDTEESLNAITSRITRRLAPMPKRRRRGDGRERFFDGHGSSPSPYGFNLIFCPSMDVVTLLVSGHRCLFRVLRSSRSGFP